MPVQLGVARVSISLIVFVGALYVCTQAMSCDTPSLPDRSNNDHRCLVMFRRTLLETSSYFVTLRYWWQGEMG